MQHKQFSLTLNFQQPHFESKLNFACYWNYNNGPVNLRKMLRYRLLRISSPVANQELIEPYFPVDHFKFNIADSNFLSRKLKSIFV